MLHNIVVRKRYFLLENLDIGESAELKRDDSPWPVY